MVRHGGSSAGSYLADPTSPIPSHCASIVVTSTLKVNSKQCLCNTIPTPFSITLAGILHAHYLAADKILCCSHVIYIIGRMACEHC